MLTVERVDFTQYLEVNLSYADFVNLNERLGISPHMKTKYLNNPRIIPLSVLVRLAGLLKTSTRDLFERFSVGAEVLTEGEKLLLTAPIDRRDTDTIY